MDKLLIKQELNTTITRDEFLKDIDSIFLILKDSYGMYEYFGEDLFEKARVNTKKRIAAMVYDFNQGISILKDELSFIKDGHFYIGKPRNFTEKYDYAVRYTFWEDVPVIDCKKLYHCNDEERKQLETFKDSAQRYKNHDPLIIDLRDNAGGSTTYIYDFLCELTDREVGYSLKYVQKNSKLFLAYLKKKGIEWEGKKEIEVLEETCPPIPNEKPIYVLFNEYSASAAEEAIAFLRNIENVTLVGNHSAGVGSCGNCISVYLPYSHLEVYFGTGLVLYDGHINIDAEGGFKGDISEKEFLELIKELHIK